MKYVKCSNCGKKIEVGSYGFGCQGLNTIFCSKKCFAEAYGSEIFLNNINIENNKYTVVDEETTKSEIEQTETEIKTLQTKLKILKKEIGENANDTEDNI